MRSLVSTHYSLSHLLFSINENSMKIQWKFYKNWMNIRSTHLLFFNTGWVNRIFTPSTTYLLSMLYRGENSIDPPCTVLFPLNFLKIEWIIHFNSISIQMEIEWKFNRIDKNRWVDPAMEQPELYKSCLCHPKMDEVSCI